MTPEEIAQSLIEQIPDWFPNPADVGPTKAVFAATIRGAIRDAYERAALVAEELERYHDLSGGEPSIAIRALKDAP